MSQAKADVNISSTRSWVKEILAGGEPFGLTTQEADDAIRKHGYNEVIVKEQPAILQLLSRYLGLVPLFMTTTAVLSAAIFTECTGGDVDLEPCECNDSRDWASFALLLVELNLIVYADYAGSKSSGDAIKQLKEASASKVGVRRDGNWEEMPTRELVPGDLVAVTIGMTIPADGVVVHDGEPLKLDYSSLTGEPLPEKKGKGDAVLSGAVVLVGEGEMVVTRTGVDSSLGTTQALIAEAKAEKETGGELASILSNVTLFLCLYGVVAAIIIGTYTGLSFGSTAGDSIKLAFVILSAILPVTMPLVLTTTLAVGSKELAADDAVVQRFSAIPEMAGMDILCSDKTGTLTLGRMTVIEEESVTFHSDVTVKDMLEVALVATRIEHSDAIDAAITKFFPDPAGVLSDYEIKKFIPFDPATKKVTAVATKKSTGEEIVVVKGAPPVLMTFEGISQRQYNEAKAALDEKSARGYKTLAVCVQTGENCWKLLGFLSILDPPRSDTAHTISKCNELGVEVKMITGDQRLIAVEVARQLGLPNTLIFEKDVFNANSHVVNQAGGFANLCEKAGGFAGVSPEHKHRVVTSLQERGHFVGMTGDGVNDAPALSIASVGIAVADATDAARGAADIVLQQEGLSTIVKAIYGSRKIFKRIETYITYRSCTSFTFGLAFILIYCVSRFDFPTWTLILMSLLNDFAVASSSKDQVVIQRKPTSLKIWETMTISAVMASISSLQVWGFVHSIVSYDPANGSHFWGLRPANEEFSGCEATAYAFLVLIITLQFDLIVARSPKPFFAVSREKDDAGHFVGIPPPGWQVFAAIGVSLAIATFIAVYWRDDIVIGSGYGLEGIGWRNAGLTWAWALLFFVVTDLCQSATVVVMKKVERDRIHGKTFLTFYRSIFTQNWDEDRMEREKQHNRESLLHDIKSYDASLELSLASVRSSITRGSALNPAMNLAALVIAEEEETEKFVTHQHELLSAETLQNDPILLRVLSEMAHTISVLQQRVDELELKVKGD